MVRRIPSPRTCVWTNRQARRALLYNSNDLLAHSLLGGACCLTCFILITTKTKKRATAATKQEHYTMTKKKRNICLRRKKRRTTPNTEEQQQGKGAKRWKTEVMVSNVKNKLVSALKAMIDSMKKEDLFSVIACSGPRWTDFGKILCRICESRTEIFFITRAIAWDPSVECQFCVWMVSTRTWPFKFLF